MSNIRYITGWKKNDPKLEKDAIAVWRECGVLPRDVAPETRAKEICSIAYDGDRVAGISTIDVMAYAPLGNRRFGFLRVFTRPEYEEQAIAIGLATQCREALRAWSIENPHAKLAGMAAIYHSAKLGHHPVGASGLTLIGYTREGHQMRVIWFNHLSLEQTAITLKGANVA